MEFEISLVRELFDLREYPAVSQVLDQRWKYSHYIHGQVAFEHGIRCGQPQEMSLAVGAALEVAWAAILLLDDILDEDDVRFHAPAAWVQYGIGPVAMEAAAAMTKAVSSLGKHATVALGFARSLEETEAVSVRLRKVTYEASLVELEPLIHSLGAMSVFATSWALPETGIGDVAKYETCAGQLVNDCNDCFGDKAKRRNYPDVRTSQPTLLSQLALSNNAYGLTCKDFYDAPMRGLAEFSEKLKKVLQHDSTCIIRYFDKCINDAIGAANQAHDAPEEEIAGALKRVKRNAFAWKNKILRLIES